MYVPILYVHTQVARLLGSISERYLSDAYCVAWVPEVDLSKQSWYLVLLFVCKCNNPRYMHKDEDSLVSRYLNKDYKDMAWHAMSL